MPPADRTLRILVVDDHAAIRCGIASLIDAESPRMRCIGAASTSSDALDHARELQPDVVVLDVDLGGEDGLALIPCLHRLAPCSVVVLTSALDHRIATRARELGARALVHKSARGGELIACVASAAPVPHDPAP